MRHAVLLLLLVLPGVIGVVVFTYFAFTDYDALIAAQRHFEQVAAASPSLPALFAAEAKQNLHRVNLFADGVWALLSAILGGIGVVGLCLLPGKK